MHALSLDSCSCGLPLCPQAESQYWFGDPWLGVLLASLYITRREKAMETYSSTLAWKIP